MGMKWDVGLRQIVARLPRAGGKSESQTDDSTGLGIRLLSDLASLQVTLCRMCATSQKVGDALRRIDDNSFSGSEMRRFIDSCRRASESSGL